jgi:hypothetical protein
MTSGGVHSSEVAPVAQCECGDDTKTNGSRRAAANSWVDGLGAGLLLHPSQVGLGGRVRSGLREWATLGLDKWASGSAGTS